MTQQLHHLHCDGVSVVVEAPDEGLPRVLHWGAPLGALDDVSLHAIAQGLSRQTPPETLDAAWELTLVPTEGDGWAGRPGLQLQRDGILINPRWRVQRTAQEESSLTVTAIDQHAAVMLTLRLEVATGGVVRARYTLRNRGSTPLAVDWLEPTLPVPSRISHLTTLDGRWSREKRPVTTEAPVGAVTRQSRRGRPGHDATTFFALSDGEPRWGSGAVWAVHTAWSADTTYRIDQLTDAVPLLGAGELLRPGEVTLGPGEEYETPATLFVYSNAGLDGIAGRVHAWLRARPQHPRTPRPFTLNTWEAVYFDQDPVQLSRLARRAGEVGVERFVLDDGWFTGRHDDTTSLGDWFVDASVWPDGLRPLSDEVHALGMQFGLWFEPEMISLDSDLARTHPDGFLHDPRHLAHDAGLSWRTQFVLDFANPDVYAYVLGRLDTLVGEIGIDYIKWDHNRDLIESMHDGRPGTHSHTLAVYRMIGELKSRHAGLEIESCSSGGARTDLGIIEFCDRVWGSDSNDPVERLDIQRWTGLLLPPELVGAHVGPTRSHSSGRVTDLSYRMATSLLCSAGLEWDILSCSPEEIAAIARFATLYKELRPLIHSARVLHPELHDPAWRATAFVTPGRDAAVVVAATVSGLADARAERLRIPGLDPLHTYRVRVRTELGAAKLGWVRPPWLAAEGIALPGSVLGEVGLQLPTLWPMQALVIHIQAEAPNAIE